MSLRGEGCDATGYTLFMPRPHRPQFEGAWYHVMNRGTAKQAIFLDDNHRQRFVSRVSVACTRFEVEVHAWCLMGNHYHLMVRTPSANLAKFMHTIEGPFARYFNATTDRDGALFRGRYHAIVLKSSAHWLGLSRYIHRNPLEAGLVTDLADYHWSSYRAYLDLEPAPEWLYLREVRDALQAVWSSAQYRSYVETDLSLSE